MLREIEIIQVEKKMGIIRSSRKVEVIVRGQINWEGIDACGDGDTGNIPGFQFCQRGGRWYLL